MTLTGKLIVSLAVALAAAALITFLPGADISFLLLLLVLFIATAATALIVTLPPSAVAANSREPQATAREPKSTSKPAAQAPATQKKKPKPQREAAGDKNREQGLVKWFNVSKGFGFITMDNGEEVFVHFRSIRGEGRRSLRDGQRVSFNVAQSDKGPQAEDVDPLD